ASVEDGIAVSEWRSLTSRSRSSGASCCSGTNSSWAIIRLNRTMRPLLWVQSSHAAFATEDTARLGKLRGSALRSVQPRHDSAGDHSAISVPIGAVTCCAHPVIASLAMQQQNGEIYAIKIGQRASKQGWKTPRDAHEKISQIVHVA